MVADRTSAVKHEPTKAMIQDSSPKLNETQAGSMMGIQARKDSYRSWVDAWVESFPDSCKFKDIHHTMLA